MYFFDVEDAETGVELVPDFFKTDMTDGEIEAYELLLETYNFQNGGIEIPFTLYAPGDRIPFNRVFRDLMEHPHHTNCRCVEVYRGP